MKDNNNLISWVGSSICTTLGLTSTSEVEGIILLTIGIISGLVSLAYDIYLWYKKATADKKITDYELEELRKTVNEDISNIDNTIDKSKKEDK